MRTLKVWNFIRAVAEFAEDGCRTVTQEQYRERLTICQDCPTRDGSTCSTDRGGCGCRIHVKAVAKVWKCPQSRWPVTEELPL